MPGDRFLVLVLSLCLAGGAASAQDYPLARADALNQQVLQLYGQGRYLEAVRGATEVLAIREKGLGPDHPDVATSLSDLAAMYERLGRYADAEPLYKRSLAIYEKALGPDHSFVAI